jgi:hypothetical protein
MRDFLVPVHTVHLRTYLNPQQIFFSHVNLKFLLNNVYLKEMFKGRVRIRRLYACGLNKSNDILSKPKSSKKAK